jgi:hypothetical protein
MCLHGESEVKKGKARFQCRRCGALTDKKDHVCKPEKTKKADKEKKAGKDRKKQGKGKKDKKKKKKKA